jgi:transcription antitermination factor NusG
VYCRERPTALLTRHKDGESIVNHQKVIYRLGDVVRIKSGPFAAFTGKVEGINQSKSLLNVKVNIFGRVTPVKVNFSEAEHLELQRHNPPSSGPN